MWSRVGIEVVPFVQYDVISAPILSLSSFTLTKPAIRSSFTRRTSSAALPSSFEHLIGASTETGIIYLWKLGSSSDKPESNNLVSMIHSSKFPLVNLTITIVPEKDTPSIVVVASDIQGSVRIHLSTLSGTTDQSSSAKGHPGSERKESLLFILQGQASFNSPIISCKFLERMHRTELSVFLVSGEMKLYPILDLLQTSRRAKEAEVVDDVPEDNFSDISEQNPSNSKPTAIVQTLEVSKSNVTDSTPLDDEYPAPPPTPIAPPTLSSYLSSPPQSPKASPTPLKLNAPGGTKKSPSKPQGPTNESPKKFAPTKASPKQSADVMQKALPETTTQSEFSSPSLHTAKVCILSLSSSSPSHQALGSYLQAQPVIEVDVSHSFTILLTPNRMYPSPPLKPQQLIVIIGRMRLSTCHLAKESIKVLFQTLQRVRLKEECHKRRS